MKILIVPMLDAGSPKQTAGVRAVFCSVGRPAACSAYTSGTGLILLVAGYLPSLLVLTPTSPLPNSAFAPDRLIEGKD
jgi:hypothetical protein